MTYFTLDKKIGNIFLKKIYNIIKHYDHEKYWRRRSLLIDPKNRLPLIVKFFYLYYIKKTDSYHNSSFGTNIGSGALFMTSPNLPHGPSGIFVGHDTIVGSNCTIFHQVTLAHGNVMIGNNVMIGAGAKILPNVTIGDNVRIGANCVVVEDIPSNSTVVLSKPRIILSRSKSDE